VPTFVLDGRTGSRVADAVVVVHFWVVNGEWYTFLDHERVGVAVDCWIYAQAEQMLVIWSEDSGCDTCAVRGGLGRVGLGWRGGEDPGCADFKVERGVLDEVEGEDVLVVRHGYDGLQNEDAGSCYDGVLRAEVGVLPKDAIILFVAADYVGEFDWRAFGVVVPGVEVLDGACMVKLTVSDITWTDSSSNLPRQSQPS
jgi:hypothetical protein